MLNRARDLIVGVRRRALAKTTSDRRGFPSEERKGKKHKRGKVEEKGKKRSKWFITMLPLRETNGSFWPKHFSKYQPCVEE